jgi:hypothetical protein
LACGFAKLGHRTAKKFTFRQGVRAVCAGF